DPAGGDLSARAALGRLQAREPAAASSRPRRELRTDMAKVTIGCFHEHLPPVARESTVVAVDVIRATTTAITAVATGKRLYPAGSRGNRRRDPGGRQPR